MSSTSSVGRSTRSAGRLPGNELTLLERIQMLEAQERQLGLDHFTNDDAWRLGTRLAARAQETCVSVVIDIRRPGLILFHSAHGAVAADQDFWVVRKSATVFRMDASSALVAARMQERGVDPSVTGWLDASYAVTGGSFPVRVHGAGLVAAVTVSGLTSDRDHDMIVQALRAHQLEDDDDGGDEDEL